MEVQSELQSLPESLHEGFSGMDFDQVEAWLVERLELGIQAQVYKFRVLELLREGTRKSKTISEVLDSVCLLEGCLQRINGWVSEEKFEGKRVKGGNLEDELDVLFWEMKSVYQFAAEVESRIVEWEEMRRKEKKEMEEKIVSLMEENRDANSLLRVALVEKAALERTLGKLKGSGEQKRVAILQIAERGLQKVGFGFMMSSIIGEPPVDNAGGSSASAKIDGGESEEEAVSVVTTFENMMKNLRLEITNLRRSLEASRLENEHLQTLTEKQAQKIAENILYIEHLEERENKLTHNVDELILEVTEAEEEVDRWRQACELEVEAGKTVIEERDREVAMLKEELARTKAALDASNNKLKLKEKLADTAVAAQEASEVSLRLADSRSTILRERIEELTKQLEEEASVGKKEKDGGHRRLRYACWPWRVLRFTPAAPPRAGNRNRRRMLPEMEALLHLI
ncbi:hypothetical protein J5N97_028916 [Dioscorea zingiberensis]|uniref:Uncharacterized protein n=1 Tax=Dioscorea zingiberensis TaxID=325984 RepID=A0A9D5C049_9LILI|nr:hypothetical protein J5N97_028916 [Dioscorea zingiberensis]